MAVIVLAVLAAIAGGYLYVGSLAERATDNTLRIAGNIEAHESVVGFKVPGRIVELPVQEGQYVNKGDLLARLDDDDYRQQVSMDEATIRTREAELKLALAGSRKQEIQAAKQSLDRRAVGSRAQACRIPPTPSSSQRTSRVPRRRP